MNDEDSSSSAALPPAPSRDSDSTAAPPANANDDGAHGDKNAEEERSKVAAKKAANIKEVIKTLDMLVYAQLASVYYMEYGPSHNSSFYS